MSAHVNSGVTHFNRTLCSNREISPRNARTEARFIEGFEDILAEIGDEGCHVEGVFVFSLAGDLSVCYCCVIFGSQSSFQRGRKAVVVVRNLMEYSSRE